MCDVWEQTLGLHKQYQLDYRFQLYTGQCNRLTLVFCWFYKCGNLWCFWHAADHARCIVSCCISCTCTGCAHSCCHTGIAYVDLSEGISTLQHVSSLSRGSGIQHHLLKDIISSLVMSMTSTWCPCCIVMNTTYPPPPIFVVASTSIANSSFVVTTSAAAPECAGASLCCLYSVHHIYVCLRMR